MQSLKSVVTAMTAAVAAVALSVAWVAPAATAAPLRDTNLDSASATASDATSGITSDATSLKAQSVADESDADAMPGNPDATLPDKVSNTIPDDATVVSEDHALTADGELKDIETGATVTDPELVGTEDSQPDPLSKTDGQSFIPVVVEEVKEKIADNNGEANQSGKSSKASSSSKSSKSTQLTKSSKSASNSSSVSASSTSTSSTTSTNATVKLASLQNNEYGAHWGTYNGTQAFFESSNALFVQQAKGVVDVSVWQGTIDWQAAKNASVEGAIIRLSYGWGNGFDQQAQRNISECKRLGIPFGVYIYSYAYDSNTAAAEGNDVVSLLRQAGVSPSDLTYPVYYDLEKWSWSGHNPPTSPSVYDGIVNTWYSKLQAGGYNNLSVYSYTSYLSGPLNSSNIHSKTRWVAQYGARMQYTAFPTNDRGWQYTSSGTVAGISGRVDLNAFGNRDYSSRGFPPSAFEVKGEMGEEWQRIGGANSVIGSPIADEVCNWKAGQVNCYQNFERGAISWTPSTGAHFTAGELRKEWAARGFEHGVLGYPIKDEESLSNGWWRQSFQNGDIWTWGSTKKYVVLLNLRDSYNQHGGYSSLGAPTSNESNPGNGYWRQSFQNGDVWTRNGSKEKYVVLFDLRDAYNANGGYKGLGGPVGEEQKLSNGYWRQAFTRGDAWTRNGSKEKYVILLNLRNSYKENGDFAALGGPVRAEENMGNGWWRQRCANGDVWSKDGTNQHYVIKYDLRDSYYSHGGYARLGAPTSNETKLSDGYWMQQAEHGDVWTRNGAQEKYVVLLNLRKTYYAKGGFNALGGPTADERNLGWIYQQSFRKGTIQAY